MRVLSICQCSRCSPRGGERVSERRKVGEERRTLSPLSRRVTASACYNFLLSLHCHDLFFFFFLSVPSDKTGLMGHPIYIYIGIWLNLNLVDFISYNFPTIVQAFDFPQKEIEIRGSLFSFPQKKFNFQMSSVDRTNVARAVPMFNSGSGFAEETVESMVGMLGLR